MPELADITSLLDVLHDPLAVALRARWNSFNPFRVLKVERREVRHTATLAWLLDPRENHGLGDQFLRGFLKNVCEKARDHSTLLSYEIDNDAVVRVHAELQMQKISGKRIIPEFEGDSDPGASTNGAGERGKRRIDVLVEGPGWALAIEAKIGATEGDRQLDDYRETIQAWARDTERKLLLVYLTIDEQDIERDSWVNSQWSTSVARPLRTVLDASGSSAQLGDQQHAFLAGYLDNLSDIAGDEHGFVRQRLSDLATKHAPALRRLKEIINAQPDTGEPQQAWFVLYERNKLLLDRLLQYVNREFEDRAARIREVLKLENLEPVAGNNSYIRFIVKKWKRNFPGIYEPAEKSFPCVLYELKNDSKQPLKVSVALQVWYLDGVTYKREERFEERNAMLRSIQEEGLVDNFPGLFTRRQPKEQFNQKVQQLVSTSIPCSFDTRDMQDFQNALHQFVTRTSGEIEFWLERSFGPDNGPAAT